QPPHVLLWIKGIAAAGGEECRIRFVTLLFGLQRFVVEPRYHLAASELDASRCAALEVKRALDAPWTDEAAQFVGEIAQSRYIAALPVDVDVGARDLRCSKRDHLLGCNDLVGVEMGLHPD